MAKQTGLGWTTFTVDAVDLRGDTTNLEFSMPQEVQDVTGIDKSAMERLPLLRDFSLTSNGIVNTAVGASHDTLKTFSASRSVAIGFGSPAASIATNCLQTDYKVSRDNSGALTWEAPFVLADGTVPTWT